jgi:lipid-A-disaccharide synthase
MNAKKILIVAGEASGDMYGARLVESIRKQSKVPIRFFGCAGKAMREAGVEPVVTVEEISVHGLVEVLFRLEPIFDGFRRLVFAASENNPDLVILIDFPDFNIRLANRLKHMGMKVVYFISPQIWAWRRGRVNTLRDVIHQMICILPFEESFYRNAGVAAEYIGHPLVEMLDVKTSEEDLLRQLKLDPARPRVAVLPGSRHDEIRHNLPPLLETVARLQRRRPDLQFVLAVSSTIGTRFVAKAVENWRRATSKSIDIQLVEGWTHGILKYSRVALVSSGTATLEAALLGTPLVCVYKVNPLSWWMGQKLVDVDYYCLVNLILGQPIVTELYQSDFTPDRLEEEVGRLLEDSELRRRMLESFGGLKSLLSMNHSPLGRAAEIILSHLETKTPRSESKLGNHNLVMELGTTT